jgi:hypothetical protein
VQYLCGNPAAIGMHGADKLFGEGIAASWRH